MDFHAQIQSFLHEITSPDYLLLFLQVFIFDLKHFFMLSVFILTFKNKFFSLGGNCMTTMIATCSVEKRNIDVSESSFLRVTEVKQN